MGRSNPRLPSFIRHPSSENSTYLFGTRKVKLKLQKDNQLLVGHNTSTHQDGDGVFMSIEGFIDAFAKEEMDKMDQIRRTKV